MAPANRLPLSVAHRWNEMEYGEMGLVIYDWVRYSRSAFKLSRAVSSISIAKAPTKKRCNFL